MSRLNLQQLRKEFSSLPVLYHHPTVIPHGRQVTNPEDYVIQPKRRGDKID